MANLFIRRGRGVPAQTHALRRTRKTILRTVTVNDGVSVTHPHDHANVSASVVRLRTGSSSIAAKAINCQICRLIRAVRHGTR